MVRPKLLSLPEDISQNLRFEKLPSDGGSFFVESLTSFSATTKVDQATSTLLLWTNFAISIGMAPTLAAGLVEMNAAMHSGKLFEDYEQHKPAVFGKVKMVDYAQEFAGIFNV